MKMPKRNPSMFFIILMLVAYLFTPTTPTITITPGTSINSPICPPTSTTQQNLDTQSQGSSTFVEYTATSSFYDHTSSEYSQIMVKSGNDTTPFKFVYFDSDSVKQEAACLGTAGFTFVKLINNFLFMKKTSPTVEFHVCQFDPAIIANSVTSFSTKIITLPTSLTPPITKFIPYSVRQSTEGSQWIIYIAFSDASTTITAKYSWTTINSQATVTSNFLFYQNLASTLTNTFTLFDGVENVIYTDVDGFAIKSSAGAYVADTTTLSTPAAGSVVRFYRTLTQVAIIGVYGSDLLSATFYLVKQGATSLEIIVLSAITSPSTSAFIDYFDDSSNIILLSSSQVIWINVALDSSIKKVFATINEIPITNLQSIGFLGSTAVFTYTDKFVTYQITADDAITKISQQSTTTPIILSSSDYQKIYALSCFCRILRTVVCYSSTLSCLLISKGTAYCQTAASVADA